MTDSVKFEGNVPATLRAYCLKNAHKIYECCAGGGYTCSESGFAYDVLLRPGWRMSDDAVHTLIEPTVKDMLRELRAVSPCECDDCQAELATAAAAKAPSMTTPPKDGRTAARSINIPDVESS